jgi:drug/metabolite transporter (DMT)-like permease
MIAAIISALANASSLITDKIVLSRERVTLRVFLPISFIFLFLVTLLLVPWLGQIDWTLATMSNATFLLFIMILLAIGWNVLYFQTLQQDKVHHHEMLQMLTPLLTVVLAAIFFPDELNGRIFVLAIVACGALIYAKSDREHFMPSQNTYNAVLGMVMLAAENIVIRELLLYYTPVALYAVRTFFLAIFFLIYYRPHLNKVKPAHWGIIAISSVLGAAMMIARFYAFSELGLVYTMMITVLAPLIVFFFSWGLLHERIKARIIVAAVVILACVTAATFIK